MAKLSLVPTRPADEPLEAWVRRVKHARLLVRLLGAVAFVTAYVVEAQSNWQTSPLYLFGFLLTAILALLGSDRLTSGIEQAEYDAEWGEYYARDERKRSSHEDA